MLRIGYPFGDTLSGGQIVAAEGDGGLSDGRILRCPLTITAILIMTVGSALWLTGDRAKTAWANRIPGWQLYILHVRKVYRLAGVLIQNIVRAGLAVVLEISFSYLLQLVTMPDMALSPCANESIFTVTLALSQTFAFTTILAFLAVRMVLRYIGSSGIPATAREVIMLPMIWKECVQFEIISPLVYVLIYTLIEDYML